MTTDQTGEKMRKFLYRTSMVLLAAMTGCVDINDAKVQVSQPEQVEQYQRSPLDKCPSHMYPHRFIFAQAGVGSTLLQGGPIQVTNQKDFDDRWNSVTPDLNEAKVPSDALKPIVNWDEQTAFFYPFTISSTCDKVVPFGDRMITDCYNITIPILHYYEKENCKPATTYPVFIYIYPKTTWPIQIQWVAPTAVPTPPTTPTVAPQPTATPVPKGVQT